VTKTAELLASLNVSRRDDVSDDGREIRTTFELLDTLRVDEEGNREVVALVISTSNHRGDGANTSRAIRTILVDRTDPGLLVFGGNVAPLSPRVVETKRFSAKQLELTHEVYMALVTLEGKLAELVAWAAEVTPRFIVHLTTPTASRVVMRATERVDADERAQLLTKRRIEHSTVRVLDRELASIG